MRALVIDDAQAARSYLRIILSDLGFEVLEAENGLAALSCLREQGKVEIAFVDLHMPEMDGLEFIGVVRSDRNYDDMRLMTVSTDTSKAIVAETLEAGADEYVMKPYTKEVIQDKLLLLGFSDA